MQYNEEFAQKLLAQGATKRDLTRWKRKNHIPDKHKEGFKNKQALSQKENLLAAYITEFANKPYVVKSQLGKFLSYPSKLIELTNPACSLEYSPSELQVLRNELLSLQRRIGVIMNSNRNDLVANLRLFFKKVSYVRFNQVVMVYNKKPNNLPFTARDVELLMKSNAQVDMSNLIQEQVHGAFEIIDNDLNDIIFFDK